MTYTIKAVDGEEIEVKAHDYDIPGLLVTQSVNHPGAWEVTHVASGLHVNGWILKTRKAAKEYALKCADLTCWVTLPWQDRQVMGTLFASMKVRGLR